MTTPQRLIGSHMHVQDAVDGLVDALQAINDTLSSLVAGASVQVNDAASTTVILASRLVFPKGSVGNPSVSIAVIDTTPEQVPFDATGFTDGVRSDFITPDYFIAGSVIVFHSGLLLRPLVGYTEDSDQGGVTLTVAPAVDDELVVLYQAQL